jgi:hypothetical protein
LDDISGQFSGFRQNFKRGTTELHGRGSAARSLAGNYLVLVHPPVPPVFSIRIGAVLASDHQPVSNNIPLYFIRDDGIVFQTMRPPKERQNRLLQPLNEIFGTEANVRLLRVLALRNTSLTAGELAKRAMLGRTSIYPALRELERTGVVEFIGAGARKLVQLRERYPLSRTFRELFRAEARRFDALTIALRELLLALPRAPISAWIDQGGENVESTDTLTLYLVARPGELDTLTDNLNNRLADVERKYDVHIAVHGLTRSELETLHRTPLATLNTVVLLGGVPPVALLERSRAAATTSTLVSHDEHDARSHRLAVAIAAKIKRDPGLISIAEDRVKRRAREASPRERRELTEWIRVLSTMSPARLQKFLLEDSERAVRLRQTLPALNLLSPVERDAVVRSQTDADVIAVITRR